MLEEYVEVICKQFEVSFTNVSVVIGIKVTKITNMTAK